MSDAGMTPGSELSGKVALVTGGARNIGRATPRPLAAGGATVMVNANTSQGDAKNTVAMIKSNGGAAAFHFADVEGGRAPVRFDHRPRVLGVALRGVGVHHH